jgi:hypothetical protein
VNFTEFCTLLRELGLLSLVEGICTQHFATLQEVHGPNLMPHANVARRAVVRELRRATCWSFRRLGQVMNRSASGLHRSLRLSASNVHSTSESVSQNPPENKPL